MTAADPFSAHMEAVARKLWGEPNPRLSCSTELRFGAQGSMSVDLERGIWHDHEAGNGGGVIDLLAREQKVTGQDAVEWLKREVGAVFEDRKASGPKSKLTRTYDYVDEHGEVLFQVCRFEPKDFRQRRPDPTSENGWSWSVKGVRQVPYRLFDLTEALAREQTVYVVEGEKDVDALAALGIPATCNAGGAGKWPDGLAEHFHGADVVIIPDNDIPGRNHAAVVGEALRGVAGRVRVLDLPDLPAKGDVGDWIASGGDVERLVSLTELHARPWTKERPKSAFGAIGWADVGQIKVSYRPLIKGLMFEGDAGMFYGESGSGKSFLGVDAGVSIARGVPFLGMKTLQGPVIYQAGEGGKGLLKRLEAYKQEHRVTADVPFELLPEKVNLFSKDGDADAFEAECMAWHAYYGRLSLIVIDTFAAASAGANENASEDMGRMLDAGYRLQHKTGAAILWVHHKNAAGLRERGHTSFRANIETVVEVIRDPETKERTLHLVKLKDGEDGLRLGFELQAVTIGTDDDGDPITSCVVRPAQVGMAQPGKRYRLPSGQAKFLKILDDAIVHRGGVLPATASSDGSTYGVQWHDFREMYVAVCAMGRNADAVRQSLKLDGDKLFNAGLIGKQDPWIWITEKGGSLL